MKVIINNTINIEPEQRAQIADLLAGSVSKKNHADREQIRTWIWNAGAQWGDRLDQEWKAAFAPEPTPVESPVDEDEFSDLI